MEKRIEIYRDCEIFFDTDTKKFHAKFPDGKITIGESYEWVIGVIEKSWVMPFGKLSYEEKYTKLIMEGLQGSSPEDKWNDLRSLKMFVNYDAEDYLDQCNIDTRYDIDDKDKAAGNEVGVTHYLNDLLDDYFDFKLTMFMTGMIPPEVKK